MAAVSRFEADLKELCELAIKNGATNAKAIKAKQIVIDERVRLKCRIPQCKYYGQNLQCPPFTPTPKEFKESILKYTHAIIVQIGSPYPEELKKSVRREGAKLSEVVRETEDIVGVYFDQIWKKLGTIARIVEREAFNRGYYLSLGLGPAGGCALCDECDVTKPCKHPFEARPSMEALGIDVFATSKNAGLEIKFPAGDKIVLNSLIIID